METVEGIDERIFYQEAEALERDLRQRLRGRTLRYRVLVLRRVIVTLEGKRCRRLRGPRERPERDPRVHRTFI
jgi:hypothetical protein